MPPPSKLNVMIIFKGILTIVSGFFNFWVHYMKTFYFTGSYKSKYFSFFLAIFISPGTSPKNNLNLYPIQIEPVTVGADATIILSVSGPDILVCTRIGNQKSEIYCCIRSSWDSRFFLRRFRLFLGQCEWQRTQYMKT